MSHLSFEHSGVASHSAPTSNFVIFSVSSKGDTVINEKIRALYAFMASIDSDIKTLIGSYGAKLEISFLVSADAFEKVKARGFVTDQESFLILQGMDARGRRKATLVYQDGREARDVGMFGALAPMEALGIKATGSPWTYDIETGLTYSTKKEWPNPYFHPGM